MSTGVVGRDTELASVRGFVSSISEGALALTLEGEAGIGKTTLWQAGLDEARDRAFRVLVARPAESETALSFSGIGDLLDTVLDEALAALPAGQRRALSLALVLGEDEGPPPDPHAIGLALLSSFRALADERPIVVAIDDVQWLDPASAGGLAFAGRRLRSEHVGLLFSRRAGLDSLLVEELRRALPSDRVWEPRGWPTRRRRSAPHRAVAPGTDPAKAGSRRGEGRVRWQPVLRPRDRSHAAAPRRRRRRPATVADSRVVARSRPWTAAASGVDREAGLRPALEARVVELENDRIRFTHPLLAAGAYETVDRDRQSRVHARLAELLEDQEARAWQLAASIGSPDEVVADALEQAAGDEAHCGPQPSCSIARAS